MDSRDGRALFDLLESAWIAKGRPPEQVTEKVLDVWIRLLADIPLKYVERALQIHGRDSAAKHPPTPADVLEIIRERTRAQWPSADEAWSCALQAMDEDQTVVWCSEIAQAWGIARPIAEDGDNIGARMAFRESYRRLVREAEEQGLEPKWEVSMGRNPMLRELPLRQAVENGRLAHDHVEPLLLAVNSEPSVMEKLLALPGKLEADEPVPAGEIFKALKEFLLEDDEPAFDPAKEAEIERRRIAAKTMVEKLQAGDEA